MSGPGSLCVRCGNPGKSRCAKCKAVNYCGPVCQREHWARGHKGQCKIISEGVALADVADVSASSKPVDLVPAIPLEQWYFPPASIQRMADFEPPPEMLRFSHAGVMNIGNTCFINSILQCLAYSSHFCLYLQSKEHSKRCTLRGNRFCALCTMEAMVEELFTSEYHLRPVELLKNLSAIGEFHLGAQDDAHSFLYGLVEAMQQSLFAEQPGRKPTSDEEHTTLLHQLFGGHSKYSTKCLACGNSSERFDFFLSVALNLSAGHSIEEALRSYFYVGDRIADWTCSVCKERKGVERQSLLYRVHPVLIVQLMRFDERGMKINDPVAFRSELDLRPVMHPDAIGAPSLYELYAVVCHYGRMLQMGHYVAFVRVQGEWFLCDDNKITPVPVNVVLQQSAYLLFYKRKRVQQRRAELKTSAGSSSALGAVGATLAANELARSKQICTVHYRQDETGSNMVDLVLRIDLVEPIASVSAIRATVVCSLGAVSVDCGPGTEKVVRRLEVPLSSSDMVCKWYREANAVVLVLPVHRGEEAVRAGAIIVPVQECSGPVLETTSPECEMPDSSQRPAPDAAGATVAPAPAAATAAAAAAVAAAVRPHQDAPRTSSLGVATPSSWHEEASYKALYTAIERSRANIDKAAVAATMASAAAAAVPSATKEIKRNDACVCGSGRKYKQCHGKE